MTQSTPPSRLPPGWSAVLDKVRQHLAQTLTDLEAREQIWPPSSPADDPSSDGIADLVSKKDYLQNLEGLAFRAEQALAEIDQQLAQEEETLRQYLAASEASRQRLADWAGCAVG